MKWQPSNAAAALIALLACAAPLSAQSPLKLYVFDCGWIQFDSIAKAPSHYE